MSDAGSSLQETGPESARNVSQFERLIDDPAYNVSVRQVGRFRWAASITRGVFRIGEYGGPYAMTRDRAIKKAMRVVHRCERRDAWNAEEQLVYRTRTADRETPS